MDIRGTPSGVIQDIHQGDVNLAHETEPLPECWNQIQMTRASTTRGSLARPMIDPVPGSEYKFMWRRFVSDRIIRRTAGGHTRDTGLGGVYFPKISEYCRDSTNSIRNPQSIVESSQSHCLKSQVLPSDMLTVTRNDDNGQIGMACSDDR